MADPFSIFTGALTVADLTVRTVEYLKSIHRIAKGVDEEIKSLELEVSNFNAVYTALGDLCRDGYFQTQNSLKSVELQQSSRNLWTRAAQLTKEGQNLIDNLKRLLEKVLGSETKPKFEKLEDIRRAIKILSKDKDYSKLRRRLANVNLELSTMLTAIDLSSNTAFRLDTYTTLEQLPGKLTEKLQDLGLQLKAQISKLTQVDKSLEPSIVTAQAVLKYTSLNEHFYVQQPDTSIWTGRKGLLDHLRDALLNTTVSINQTQKRFVVYGISGAGKTQLCCKFAQDYRESFWGIFWVDASNIQNANESWKKIAKIGGRDANEEAGKHWLSNLSSPWLLVIDSADNSEKFIHTQFPSGDRGYVLITTRNPRLKITATVGHLHLDRLEESEANDLLRKATEYRPWDASAESYASSISRHLGYLPIALVHAGRAIFHKLCTLQGYIPFFDRTLDTLRSRRSSKSSFDDDEDSGMGAVTTFDIIYSGIEAQGMKDGARSEVYKDAIELINLFAFLPSSDIRFEILIRAGRNLQEHSKVENNLQISEQALDASTGSATVIERLSSILIGLVAKLQHPTVALPRLLVNIKFNEFQERMGRARKAMNLLVQMSLISESSEAETYSMHALVHMWIRKRMGLSAQALWCKTAASCIANAVKLPPIVDEAGDRDFYIRILNHVSQIQQMDKDIENHLEQKREVASNLHGWKWLGKPISSSVSDIHDLAKFSRVYLECSKYEEAEKSLRTVLGFAIRRLGPGHGQTFRIQLILSTALWHLGRPLEAQEMQEEALQASRSRLGSTHPQTLIIMDALGETLWQRGRLKEAKKLHEDAIEGFEAYPKMIRERLKAMSHLGDIHDWYTNYEQARDLHQVACNGLTEAFGAKDLDTIAVKDHLAMSCLFVGGVSQVRYAHDLMIEVYEGREQRFGKEHAYTLWSACNLARILATRGHLEKNDALIQEAKTIFQDGLEVAKINWGVDHIGTLMGQMHLANTLVLEKRYDDAEKAFKDIAERQKNLPSARAGTHRDRLATLEMLTNCYELQDRFVDAVQVCEQIMEEFDALGGYEHPLRKKMACKRERLLEQLETT